MVTPLPRAKVEEKAIQFLKSKLHAGFASSSVTEEKYIAIPFWRVNVWAHTWFNGYTTRTKTQTYYVGKQMMTRSYTVYVPTRGEWTDQVEFKTVARKNAAFFGLEEVESRVEHEQALALDPKTLIAQKMQVLDIEISGNEANESGRTYAEDQHYRKARSETSKLYDCRTDTRIVNASLTLYPTYTVNYQFEGRTYRMTLDGATGEIVKAELPLTRGLRLTYAGIAYAILIGLAILTEILSSTARTQSLAPLTAIGSIVAAIPLFYATASQRVKEHKH